MILRYVNGELSITYLFRVIAIWSFWLKSQGFECGRQGAVEAILYPSETQPANCLSKFAKVLLHSASIVPCELKEWFLLGVEGCFEGIEISVLDEREEIFHRRDLELIWSKIHELYLVAADKLSDKTTSMVSSII